MDRRTDNRILGLGLSYMYIYVTYETADRIGGRGRKDPNIIKFLLLIRLRQSR